MLQIVPMTVEQALKASETYASPINGDMVSVLAAEVRRLTELMDEPITARIYGGNDLIVNAIDLCRKTAIRIVSSSIAFAVNPKGDPK